jgi:hypothetical protein
MKIKFKISDLKKSFLLALLACSFATFSQTTCSNFSLVTDFNDYTANPTTHDTLFVKYVQFDISDTSNISRISYSLTDMGTSTVLQSQDYTFSGPFSAGLTVVNNWTRTQHTVKISLGEFAYQEKNFRVTIDLKNAGGSVLGSSNFDFSH